MVASWFNNVSKKGNTQEGSRIKKTILLPDIDWVEIPAGAFIYGEQDRQQKLELERFFISRFPITNSQYQTFIEAGGYKDDRWWQGITKPELKEPRWKPSNRPRENVNWYEAVAFTRWLSAQLGFAVTLPTEQQWEKAARGTDGREYPWGADFKSGDANVSGRSKGEDFLEETTAVGMYSHRSSPYGVADLAGNVWEWCLNKFDKSEEIDADSSADRRVLRGGSLYDDPGSSRSSFRYWDSPNGRHFSFGFRVVSLSPSTDP